MNQITIDANFDGGNIIVVNNHQPGRLDLAIKSDRKSDFYQWFYFRAAGIRDQNISYVITNAAGAAYPRGWENYQAVASYDRNHWFRINSRYTDGKLTIEHVSNSDQMYLAYFAPYSLERHANLIARAQSHEYCQVETLGHSLDGRAIDCLHFKSSQPAPKQLWFIARQHPGETMAEWWMEGFINRLLDRSDPVVRWLLDQATVHVVPNMNPDGSFRGHLRTNAAGTNLNREWAAPSAESSPEVLCVLQTMHSTGVDFALDVHGDESIPANFIAGTEGVPSWNATRQQKLELFKSTLARLNPDFQTELGYPANPPGKANLGFCSNQLAETFGCPAMTLEMPFKDASNQPDPVHGWSPERSGKLAASCLDAIRLCWDQVIA